MSDHEDRTRQIKSMPADPTKDRIATVDETDDQPGPTVPGAADSPVQWAYDYAPEDPRPDDPAWWHTWALSVAETGTPAHHRTAFGSACIDAQLRPAILRGDFTYNQQPGLHYVADEAEAVTDLALGEVTTTVVTESSPSGISATADITATTPDVGTVIADRGSTADRGLPDNPQQEPDIKHTTFVEVVLQANVVLTRDTIERAIRIDVHQPDWAAPDDPAEPPT